jgi:hypothetical protein
MSAAPLFMIAIVAVGLLRLGLTLAGVPDAKVKYASMTVLIIAGAIYLGITSATWRERMRASYLLILPYMSVELLALGYTWASGRPTIFHTPEYSFNTTLPVHFFGHLIGGLSWEPLTVFLLMQGAAFLGRKLSWSHQA